MPDESASPTFLDFAADQLEGLKFQPPPMEPERFWKVVDALGWGRDTTETKVARERARGMLSLVEALAADRRLGLYETQLCEVVMAACERGEAALPEGGNEDDVRDTALYTIGLGREAFAHALRDPARVAAQVKEFDYEHSFDPVFSHAAWLPDASVEALEEALRAGSTIRSPKDPAGLGRQELYEHPEHGLGLISLDIHSNWLWLIFKKTELSMQRQVAPIRQATLYRGSGRDLEFWHACLATTPAGAEIFECTGPLGDNRWPRFYEPRPREEADAIFAARVAAAREDSFEERTMPETTLAVQLTGGGLTRGVSTNHVASQVAAALRESGNGRYTRMRVSRSAATLFFAVFDPESATRAIAARLARIDAVGEAFRIASLQGETPEVLHPAGDKEPFSSEPTGPCEVHEEQAYFSKLSITPDASTGASAEREAKDAVEVLARDYGVTLDGSVGSLAKLDAVIEALCERQKADTLPKEELGRLCGRIGCYTGEVLRHAVGGVWGVGALFSEWLFYGLLLGERGIKWWPVTEVRAFVEGRRAGLFSARCQALIERAGSDAPDLGLPADRLYPLGANEGYFDAGVTQDGRQALMAAFYTDTFCLFFDQEGRLLEYATVEPLPGSPEEDSYGPSRAALLAWQREIGFTPKTIHVRRFSNAEQSVGIEDLPSHFLDFLEDPERETPKEREEMAKSIQRWVEAGEFVLYWGNDLWLDARGHVTSS